jgi:hypothetical protein
MTFTDTGLQIPGGYDWCPLAAMNGFEHGARLYRVGNLYRFRRAPVSWALFGLGYLAGRVHQPAWVPPRGVAVNVKDWKP